MIVRFAKWFCGFSETADEQRLHKLEMEMHVAQTSSLKQSPWEKKVLRTNLIIIVLSAIGLYAFFSVNPFTTQEIDHLRELAVSNRSL